VNPKFRQLFDREFDAMVGLARVLSGDPGEVEDIVMDAFLETGRRFDSLTNPGGYLRTSVINGARRRYRNRVTRSSIRTRYARTLNQPDVPEIHQHYLDDMLQSLSEPEHTTIVLLYYVGTTHAEAAEIMECPVGTVKSHAHRALRNLRQQVLQ
jgi:RNA polymerase sigma-70 factor (ECF subfamily)